MKKISITHMDNRHNDWLRAITFYKQELALLRDRLTMIAGKNTGIDVLRQVEHFENQLTLQTDHLDRLQHEIGLHVASIAKQAAEAKTGYIDGTLLGEHQKLEEQYLQSERIVNELRQELNRFAADWL